MVQDEYKVELEVFEGPLDLLLYLIRRDEIDIYDIPIVSVTDQYIAYLNLMRMLDLNIAGEFLVMAATLMMLKSRMLLPVEERPMAEDDAEEGEDPRWELVRQLVEYKKFKDAAAHLQEREWLSENTFQPAGTALLPEPEDPGLSMQDISLFDLMAAFQRVLQRAAEESLGEIFGERYTVAEKIAFIVDRVSRGTRLQFTDLFDRMTSRQELVCTFLALLELIRLRQVDVVQPRPFDDIEIRAAASVAV